MVEVKVICKELPVISRRRPVVGVKLLVEVETLTGQRKTIGFFPVRKNVPITFTVNEGDKAYLAFTFIKRRKWLTYDGIATYGVYEKINRPNTYGVYEVYNLKFYSKPLFGEIRKL